MNKWYSILYKRVKQNDNMFVFIPVYYIGGAYNKDDKSFYDDGGNLYFSNEEYEIVSTAEEHTHYYPIHIDDLLNRYRSMDEDSENLSEPECLSKYFEDIKNTILIGNIEYVNKRIDLISMTLEKWKELTKSVVYSIDKGEGIVTLTKAQLESIISTDSKKTSTAVKGLLKNVVSMEKMAKERQVSRVEMNAQGTQITKIEMMGNNEPIVDTKGNADIGKATNDITKPNKYDSQAILKYISERMILPKEANVIEAIVSLILGNLEATIPEEINHIFSVGPTGTGKTYIYKLLGKVLDIPVIVEDCNSIVQEGYVGTSIEDLLLKIYLRCDNDIKKTERAIVYLDELDKIASRGSNVSDIGAQSALLKFIEGSTYTITVEKATGKKVTIDTSMMSICAGGAFSDLTFKKNPLGFGSSQSVIEKIIPSMSDIVKYGMLPELMGRFTDFAYYEDYTKEEYKKVLLESLDSPFLVKRAEFERRFNVDISATDDFFDRLAEESVKKQTGFRGIKLAINKALLPARICLQFSDAKYKKLIIDCNTVENPKAYVLI
jgi:ATP-dependent protease Clp, ATPase subunit